MKSRKEHNNKTAAYMHTYMNSKANSEHTLQSICNVVFEVIKNYTFTTFGMTIL